MAFTDNQHIIYEYPLQERVRTYLRLEHGFEQLNVSRELFQQQPDAFFQSLFSLSDLLERVDIRTELSKDLDAQQQRLKQWEQHPQVDRQALRTTIEEIGDCQQFLPDIPKVLREIKDDALLASIRQRFSQPGISGLFELPQLQLWLSQENELQQKQCDAWCQLFQPIEKAVQLKLTLMREQSSFSDMTLTSGFMQGSSEQPLAMLRIKVPKESSVYPVISGHKQRFTVRFMPLPGVSNTQSIQSVQLEIARCAQ